MNVVIKQFGDLHYNSGISKYNMQYLKEKLCYGNPDYIIFTGDLIDSNEFIRSNPNHKEYLLKWLESISKNSNTLVTLGNHDGFSKNKKGKGWIYDTDTNFWKEVASIQNIIFIPQCHAYEDSVIYVSGVNPEFKYYENGNECEDKALLIRELKKQKTFLQNLPTDKLKIFLSHSPVYMTDIDVLEYIKDFDLILSGHMHNEQIVLIITGGITKIVHSTGLGILNKLFPMQIEQIQYDNIQKNIKVKTLKL